VEQEHLFGRKMCSRRENNLKWGRAKVSAIISRGKERDRMLYERAAKKPEAATESLKEGGSPGMGYACRGNPKSESSQLGRALNRARPSSKAPFCVVRPVDTWERWERL